MNGLLGTALFRVTRLCGGVNRETLGHAAFGNHLTLRIGSIDPTLQKWVWLTPSSSRFR